MKLNPQGHEVEIINKGKKSASCECPCCIVPYHPPGRGGGGLDKVTYNIRLLSQHLFVLHIEILSLLRVILRPV